MIVVCEGKTTWTTIRGPLFKETLDATGKTEHGYF